MPMDGRADRRPFVSASALGNLRCNGLAHLRGVGAAAQVGCLGAGLDDGFDGRHDGIVAARQLPSLWPRKSSISAPDQTMAIGLAMFWP